MKPNSDIFSEMKMYDAMILPSFYEGCPNAIIDAMFYGMPILASNVSDNSIYLNHQKELLFNPNDIDEIKLKLDLFVNLDLTRINKISNQNRINAKKFFDPKKMINSYIKLF